MIPQNIVDKLPRHKEKTYEKRALSDIKRIVLHTTDWDTTIPELAKYDISPNHISDTGCPAITYHEVVMSQGTVFKTLDYTEVSWHAGVWNPGSLAIALMYRVSNHAGVDTYGPTEDALITAKDRCVELCLQLHISPDNVVGHRELQFTGWNWGKGSKILRKTCPGMKIDLDLFRYNIATDMQRSLATLGLYTGPIDGKFGKMSKAALLKYPGYV